MLLSLSSFQPERSALETAPNLPSAWVQVVGRASGQNKGNRSSKTKVEAHVLQRVDLTALVGVGTNAIGL